MTACMIVVAFVLPAGAVAMSGTSGAYVPPSLLAAASADPDKEFSVIVEAVEGKSAADADKAVKDEFGKVRRKFGVISGVASTINGKRLLKLAEHRHVRSITPDSATRSMAYENNEMWRQTVGADKLWGSLLSPAPQAPAIAIVDSGVDATLLADFGTRVVAQTVICSLCPVGATGDEQGHGTMVAGLAAGAALTHEGVAQNAPIVSIRVANKDGQSKVSDVIAAVDWIIDNKAAHNIRVANFSLARADVTNYLLDPLNHAVEKLWFNDVVVVAAAGNHGSATGPVSMKSPGNDPFVITVGATDQRGTTSIADDVVPAWSAYGHSSLGIAKPDVSAPGRYLISSVPRLGTLPVNLPARVTATGYMWMSGTSFSSGIVAGAAAQILARHAEWTPDQVKGALMLTAGALTGQGWKGGVGEVNVAAAAALTNPPSPSVNLNKFVTGSGGKRSFDGTKWNNQMAIDPSWTTSSWTESSWVESSWNESTWSESTWSESTWTETTSAQSTWTESTWSESTWSESTWVE